MNKQIPQCIGGLMSLPSGMAGSCYSVVQSITTQPNITTTMIIRAIIQTMNNQNTKNLKRSKTTKHCSTQCKGYDFCCQSCK